jgi:hypothetical protein
MKIETLKELEQLIKLCKKQGIKAIKIDNIEFGIEEQTTAPAKRIETLPEEAVRVPAYNGAPLSDPGKVETAEELTDEQKLFWSSDSEEAAQ